MEEPRAALTANDDERAEPPDFDALTSPTELVRGERTRDDFLDAVLALNSPATVREVADRADHGVDAAREYLEWFERMGIVRKVTDSPATYNRNQSYLRWRRVQHLRDEYTTEELRSHLDAEAARDEDFVERFDVTTPAAVSVSRHAAETDRSVSEVWEDVSAWQTSRRRLSLLERALTIESDDLAGERSAV